MSRESIFEFVARQSPANNNVNRRGHCTVGICYQAMASEDTEELASAVVRSRVHELVRMLKLLIVKSYKS
jgi:hypothetical protein